MPNYTREPKTILESRDETYYNFEHFKIYHEMVIPETGLAFGFIDGEPQELEFQNYIKQYTVECYLNRDFNYIMLGAPSLIVNDLIKVLKSNSDLGTQVTEYRLDLHRLYNYGKDYLGAWFKNVSTRVSSTGLFGSDLNNDPLFDRIVEDGGELSSVAIPVDGLRIQINYKAGVSSRNRFETIEDELNVILSLKDKIIDEIKIK